MEQKKKVQRLKTAAQNSGSAAHFEDCQYDEKLSLVSQHLLPRRSYMNMALPRVFALTCFGSIKNEMRLIDKTSSL